MLGKNTQGLTMAQKHDDGTIVFIQNVNIKLQILEKLNESPYACRVVGIMETSADDP